VGVRVRTARLALAGIAGLALLLASCGQTGGSATPTASSPPALTATTSASANVSDNVSDNATPPGQSVGTHNP
jgi:hypothetical protein